MKTWSPAKRRLAKMALGNEPRPPYDNPLFQCFRAYAMNNTRDLDPTFAQFMRWVAPSWFEFRSYSPKNVQENKATLIKLAQAGGQRPRSHTGDQMVLGRALLNYTRKSSSSYDPEFDAQVRKLRPDWFYTKKTRNELETFIAKYRRVPHNQESKTMRQEWLRQSKAGSPWCIAIWQKYPGLIAE